MTDEEHTEYLASIGAIESALSSLGYTAPELLDSVLRQMMDGMTGLLHSLGYEVHRVDVVKSSTPSGVEGGSQGPVVAVTEPAPGLTGVAPARASIENGGAS